MNSYWTFHTYCTIAFVPDMRPTLYYAFKGLVHKPTFLCNNALNVRKIISMDCTRRLFRIKQPEYAYNLNIKYLNTLKQTITSVAPVVTFFPTVMVGVSFYPEYIGPTEQSVVIRYKTEQESIQEMNAILRMQNLIKQYDNEQTRQLQEFVNTCELEQPNHPTVL